MSLFDKDNKIGQLADKLKAGVDIFSNKLAGGAKKIVRGAANTGSDLKNMFRNEASWNRENLSTMHSSDLEMLQRIYDRIARESSRSGTPASPELRKLYGQAEETIARLEQEDKDYWNNMGVFQKLKEKIRSGIRSFKNTGPVPINVLESAPAIRPAPRVTGVAAPMAEVSRRE